MDVLGIILTAVFLIIIIPLVIYMFWLDQKDKEAWLKNKQQHEAEEKEAEKWVKKSFRPQMLHLFTIHRKKIILYFFVLFALAFILWLFLLDIVGKQMQ